VYKLKRCVVGVYSAHLELITLSNLDIVRKQLKYPVKALGQAAERAFSWLWLERDHGN